MYAIFWKSKDGVIEIMAFAVARLWLARSAATETAALTWQSTRSDW
jgi:hypothetical protein